MPVLHPDRIQPWARNSSRVRPDFHDVITGFARANGGCLCSSPLQRYARHAVCAHSCATQSENMPQQIAGLPQHRCGIALSGTLCLPPIYSFGGSSIGSLACHAGKGGDLLSTAFAWFSKRCVGCRPFPAAFTGQRPLAAHPGQSLRAASIMLVPFHPTMPANAAWARYPAPDLMFSDPGPSRPDRSGCYWPVRPPPGGGWECGGLPARGQRFRSASRIGRGFMPVISVGGDNSSRVAGSSPCGKTLRHWFGGDHIGHRAAPERINHAPTSTEFYPADLPTAASHGARRSWHFRLIRHRFMQPTGASLHSRPDPD